MKACAWCGKDLMVKKSGGAIVYKPSVVSGSGFLSTKKYCSERCKRAAEKK